eukprot:GDKK01077956.1.p1 GENE.GDKK01077956.1~~GDKK01077956.1.p1  ORF type:complete len:257 (+),score=21.41 GDKK01077956.1:84-773(+)
MADQKVVLSKSEKLYTDYLSDLYAVIVQIEKLEKANLREYITPDEYDTSLRRLLSKFKDVEGQLTSSDWFSQHSGSIEDFWKVYCGKCLAARKRIREGHPKDAAQAAALRIQQQQEMEKQHKNSAKIFETGQLFVTLVDCIKLGNTTIDELFPILNDIVSNLRKGFAGFELLPKLEVWYSRMEAMHPSDTLQERDSRELAFDLVRANEAFRRFLQEAGKGDGASTPSSP